MDLAIEAIGHPNQEHLREYYSSRLNKKFGKYDFAKRMDVKVKDLGKDGYEVSLSLQPVNGSTMFARSKNSVENRALADAMKKLHVQVEKYKQQHYHSSQKLDKLEQLED